MYMCIYTYDEFLAWHFSDLSRCISKNYQVGDNRGTLLCYLKLCASFGNHWWIETGVTVRNAQFRSKSTISLTMWHWNLTDDLENNRAPLLSNIKLYVSFHHHMWIQTGVTFRKLLSWVVTSVTLTFDLWPWPFAWTLRWSLVIIPENFMMIRWWEHSQRGVTDGQTDRWTEKNIHRAAWSQLKTVFLGMGISIIKINLSHDFIMGIFILLWWHLYIEMVPSC